jgi:F-type H+-transporting ATPase subunit delta
LFELAEGPALDGVARDFEALRGMLADSADLRRAIASPLIPPASLHAAINGIADDAKFNELTKRFLGVVARNNRLSDLGAIAEAFLSEVADRRGFKQVEVIAAKPLDDARRAAIEANLNQALAAKTVLSVKIDPAIIGGLIIRVGSRLIDASVKTKLDRLGRVLKTAA